VYSRKGSRQAQEPAVRPSLARLISAAPHFVTIVAPAGYGKTTLAQAYAERFPSFATIDCARARSPRAFSVALVEALRDTAHDDPYFEQILFSLAWDELTPHVWDRAILAWQNAETPSAVIFDNLESASDDVRSLLVRALESRPASRTCIVCSRSPVDVRAYAIASPAQTVRLSAEDLAITDVEFRDLFADCDLPEATLRRAADVARGWPLVALLLRRLAYEGRLEPAVAGIGAVPDFDDACAFIADEVLRGLSEESMQVLVFARTVDDASDADVRACLGAAALKLLGDLSSSGLLRVRVGRVEVHPLIAATLDAQTGSVATTMLETAARIALKRGERQAAALRFARAGKHDEAAAIVSDMLEEGATGTAAAFARSVEPVVLERHPRLFALALVARRHDLTPVESLVAARRYKEVARANDDEIAQFVAVVLEAHQLIHHGLLDEAREGIARIDEIAKNFSQGNMIQRVRASVVARFAMSLRAALAALAGEHDQAERLLNRARFALGQFPVIAVSAAGDGWAHVAFARGDLRLLRIQLSRAKETVARAGLDAMQLDLDAHEAFGGWLLGDDALFTSALDRIRARARTYATPAFDHLLGCAGVREACEPTGLEPLRRLIFAHLIASVPGSSERAHEHAAKALFYARESGWQFYIALAQLAAAHHGVKDVTQEYGAHILSPAVRNALLARLRGVVQPRKRAVVTLLTEHVRCDGQVVELAPRERDVLLALALRARETPSNVLSEQLGDNGETLTLAGVHSLIHRLKRRFGDVEIVERTSSGYALRGDVAFDLIDIAELLERLPHHFDDVLRMRLHGIHVALCEELARIIERPKVLAAFERFIRSSCTRLTALLAQDALENDDAAAALTIASRLSAADPCDEDACRIAIHARLLDGDRQGAQATLDAYAAIVRRDLHCEPTESLRALLA
jgi:DNA-binding SARP family transcriptional activator